MKSVSNTLNVIGIAKSSMVDGPGLRTAIFFAGCQWHCKGCHNPDSWNKENGTVMTYNQIISAIKKDKLATGVSLTGGDPLFQKHELLGLIKEIKTLPNIKNIWMWTGFSKSAIDFNICNNTIMKEIFDLIDVVIPEQFQLDKRDPNLLFRGSSNQRIYQIDHASGYPILIDATDRFENNRIL